MIQRAWLHSLTIRFNFQYQVGTFMRMSVAQLCFKLHARFYIHFVVLCVKMRGFMRYTVRWCKAESSSWVSYSVQTRYWILILDLVICVGFRMDSMWYTDQIFVKCLSVWLVGNIQRFLQCLSKICFNCVVLYFLLGTNSY